MLSHLLKENAKVTVSTGNVLNVSDLRKKAGQKPTDEVSAQLIMHPNPLPGRLHFTQHSLTRFEGSCGLPTKPTK